MSFSYVEQPIVIRALIGIQKGLQAPSHNLSVLVAGALLVLIAHYLFTRPRLNVPILLEKELSAKQRAAEYNQRPRELMWKGYTQYRDQIFGITTNDGTKVVLPARFLDELKSHPALTFKASIDNDMLARYTFFGGPPEYVINTIKGNLNPSLSVYSPVLHNILITRFPECFEPCKDWTSVKISHKALRLVGTTSARVFHSTTAAQNEEWLTISTGYVTAVFECIRALKAWPPYLRPFVYHFIPQRGAILEIWRRARPFVAASLAEKRAKNNAFLESPGSMLDFLTSGKNVHLKDDVEKQLLYQMTLVAVGTVTTYASVVQCIFDLAAYPEYQDILREEIANNPRGEDGYYSKDSLALMTKLDSFMKESQRMSAPDLTTFQRCAIADLTLSNGLFIPQGTKLETATCSIQMDREIYTNPTKFDGLRFYHQRQAPGEENKHLFISAGKNDLSFGYGRHACPGRFLSNGIIKMILIEILLNFDVKCADGQGRPKNIEFETISEPDPDAEILMRSRIVSKG